MYKLYQKSTDLAEANYTSFSPQTIKTIVSNSRDLLILVNKLAANFLFSGYQLKADTINEEIFFKTIKDISL